MRSHVPASEQDFARLSSAEEIRRRCREALTGQSGTTSSTSSSADQELACVQFLTSRCLGSSSNSSSSTSVSLYSIFVQADGAEPTLLHLLAQRLGNTSPDMRTRILSCLNAFHMPEYLLPAFLASLENAQWQVRLQAILALQSLQRFTQQQKQILEGALTKILESDSSDLVKQASKQTLALWEEFAGYEDSSSAGVAGAAAGAVGGNGTAGGATSLGTTMGGSAVGVGGGLSMPSGMIPGGFIGATSDAGGKLQHLQPHAILGMSASLEGEQQHQHQHQHKQQGVNTSLSSTHLDTSFDSSNDSLRSAFQNSTTLMNKYLVPENFADRLARGDTTEVMQLLEDTHQVILGGTPIGFDPHTCQCVSLLDVTVLKRVVEAILGIAHFKVSLTTLYIIGDLVAHESIQMLRVLPRVLHRILEKLADAKFVIRQTTCKLLTKIIGAMLSDPGSDLTQMAHLLFEEFEASTTNSAKCESLITVMTTLVTLHPKLAEMANPRFSKWFDKAKDERACILLGEGLAVCARLMPPGESRINGGYGLDRPENYSHTSAIHLNILKAQVSLGRENVRLPAVNDESLLEYAQSIQASLDGNTFSAQIQHGYDIFGGRKMPAPILKSSSSRCEDDKMSAVSSRARSRVTFSEPGDEKPTKSSASSTCGGSSSGASSSSGDSRPFVQFNSPKKSLADEVHNFLSSDLDLLSSTSDGHLHTSSARLRPPPQVGVNHFAPGAPLHAAHVGFHGSATTKMSSSTSRGGGGAAAAPHHQHHFGHHTGGFQNFGGGHLPAGFSGAGGASSSTFVQDPFSYHDPLSMNASFGASTATAPGAHGHHHSGTITMGMGSAAGAGGVGAVGTSTTNMLQLHIPGGGGHHGLPPSSMDQHSTNHEHNQSIRDRLRLLKARVRTDQRGLLRSEGSMQPSTTASMHNLDQRSVMSAGEPIPWGLGVISLSKVDNFQIGGHLGRESLGLDRNMVRESFGGSKGNKQMARSRSDTTSTGLRGNPRRFQF